MSFPGAHPANNVSPATDTYLAEYGGLTESQFAKASIMKQFVRIQPVRGTNTLQNNRVGRTTLKNISDQTHGLTKPGERPGSGGVQFGTVSVTVDTIILARDTVAKLDVFQSNFDHRAEIAIDHGKEIGKFFDESMLIMTAKGSALSAPAGLNGAIGAGKLESIPAAFTADELAQAIQDIIVTMEDEDIDIEGLVIFVRPTDYAKLLDSGKLMDRDFSEGNDFAKGVIKEIYGTPIVKTARLPRAPIANHLLGASYNWSTDEATTKSVVMHPRSLLAGESIPMTSDVYYDNKELTWFIDSHLSFAASVNRPDLCGSVRANA